MKRIIDGKTYNTETATKVGAASFDPHNPGDFDWLYQTRHGAFFRHYGGMTNQGDDFEVLKPATPEEAKAWLASHDLVDELEALFGEQPEAGEAESRITVRIPDSLKARIEGLAAANKQSMNAWIMRCLEACADAQTSAR